MAGDEQDRQLAVADAQALHEGNAGAARHTDVAKDNPGPVIGDHGQRLQRIGAGVNGIAALRQQQGIGVQYIGIVINQ